jgi:predicted nucleic acid-binding protein
VTRYAIDALTAIRLVRDAVTVSDEHQLVAPKSLQTQALSHLYREVRKGSLSTEQARAILDGITTMRIRLLGDRVSRGVAWKLAEQLDWDDTTNAEYIAVAKLQADFFVTLDEHLASQVSGIVAIAQFEALLTRVD